MDFEAFRKNYFRFWDREDLPSDNTFDKYQKAYFAEKRFAVEVTDGQLNLEFQGESFACSRLGRRDLPCGEGGPGRDIPRLRGGQEVVPLRQRLQTRAPDADRRPASADGGRHGSRGFVAFQRDSCRTCVTTTRPADDERVHQLRGEAFAGELEPVTLGLVPLRRPGQVAVSVGDLTGPGGTIPRRPSTSGMCAPHQPGHGGRLCLHD